MRAIRRDWPPICRSAATDGTKDARLFTGSRGGRITTAVLRDATGWDEAVTKLGHEHLRRHDLRHTALTWFADAGVLPHQLQKIAGHGSLATTQRYLHPDRQSITAAGVLLSRHLGTSAPRHVVRRPRRRGRLNKSYGAELTLRVFRLLSLLSELT